MRTITNANLTFTNEKDIYFISNRGIVNFSFSVKKIEENKSETVIVTNALPIVSLAPANKVSFTLNKDGKYRIDFNLPNEPSIYFLHFKGERDMLLKAIKKELCSECGCNDGCKGCGTKEANDCIRTQSLFTLIQNYIYLNRDFTYLETATVSDTTFDFFKKTFNTNYYFLNRELSKQLLADTISGKTSVNQTLFRYYIGIYYMGLYLEAKEEILATDLDKLQWLDKIYFYDKLAVCLKAVNVITTSFTAASLIVKDSKVYYWQLDNISDDLNTIMSLVTTEFLTLKPVDTLAVFSEGKIIPLIKVSRLAFCVTNILNTTFVIADSLGNDVTDNFDYYYNGLSRSAIFVSKLVYAPSNMYFNFKQIL